MALMRIWKGLLPALRTNASNACIYFPVAAELNASLPPGEGRYSVGRVKQKMDSLNKKNRELQADSPKYVMKQLSPLCCNSSFYLRGISENPLPNYCVAATECSI